MRSFLVGCSAVVCSLVVLSGCHDVPQAPLTEAKPGPEWIRITMDDGVTDYPSWGGLDLLSQADTEFDFLTVETEFGTLHYGGCVQNCQDPARWLVGTIDSGIYRGLGENASSVRTPTGIAVVYEDNQDLSHPYQVKVGTCSGVCYLKSSWVFGDVFDGFLGSEGGTHSRVLAADSAGGLNLLYRSAPSFATLSYAHCPASCATPASWQAVRIDSGAFVGTDAALSVGPSGSVQALVQGADSAHALTYFSCDTGCTSLANWSSLVLAMGYVGGTPTILSGPGGTLYASWGNGHHGPAPIEYATCASACLTLGSWSFTSLPATAGTDVTMLLDGAGTAWLATSYGSNSHYDGKTAVLHCQAACDNSGSWTTMTIDSLGDGLDIAMALDAQGQPRIFVSGTGVHYVQRPDTTVLVH